MRTCVDCQWQNDRVLMDSYSVPVEVCRDDTWGPIALLEPESTCPPCSSCFFPLRQSRSPKPPCHRWWSHRIITSFAQMHALHPDPFSFSLTRWMHFKHSFPFSFHFGPGENTCRDSELLRFFPLYWDAIIFFPFPHSIVHSVHR